ncbi:hypothetical protein M2360_003911 [Rhizobium sp. SG_E_25_P2]|nr:hypothetical protein [Rhizobium sp. SG_E_25_P2]
MVGRPEGGAARAALSFHAEPADDQIPLVPLPIFRHYCIATSRYVITLTFGNPMRREFSVSPGLLGQSSLLRVAFALVVVAGLWAAVVWAVALP